MLKFSELLFPVHLVITMFYEVERITAKFHDGKTYKYSVKWKDCREEQLRDLGDLNCDELLVCFEAKRISQKIHPEDKEPAFNYYYITDSNVLFIDW